MYSEGMCISKVQTVNNKVAASNILATWVSVTDAVFSKIPYKFYYGSIAPC